MRRCGVRAEVAPLVARAVIRLAAAQGTGERTWPSQRNFDFRHASHELPLKERRLFFFLTLTGSMSPSRLLGETAFPQSLALASMLGGALQMLFATVSARRRPLAAAMNLVMCSLQRKHGTAAAAVVAVCFAGSYGFALSASRRTPQPPPLNFAAASETGTSWVKQG